MPRLVRLHRFAALFLAVSLVLGPSFPFAGADDLRHGQSHGASFVAIGTETDFDGSRFARRVYSSLTENNFVAPALAPASFWFRTAGYPLAAPRKLYRLKAVFLI